MQFNNHPIHMPLTTTSHIHLRSHVNQKPMLYGTAQRKHSYPYRKFQTGTTTTFSGYTNISNSKTKNYFEKNPQSNINKIQNNSNVFPTLMSIDCYQQPPRKNRRSVQHAEQYRNQAPTIMNKYENKKNYRSSSRSNKFTGIVLSDSMCKYVRAAQVCSQNVQVRISFESGCDCTRMLNYLEQQSIENNFILQSNFIVFSLCTNDVANLGPNLAIQHCRLLIQRTRQLFPRLKSIGWLALSPRNKPSKLYHFSEIDRKYKEFNQLLKNLSNEMNFQIINANLQKQHMHEDGLHPSIQTGRILIERAIKNWFSKQKDTFSFSNVDNFHEQMNMKQQQQHFNPHNLNKQQHRYHQQQQQQYHHKQQQHRYQYQQQQQQNHHNRRQHQHDYPIDINNKNINIYQSLSSTKTRKQQQQQISQETQSQSGKAQLINHYPHFLRHKEEFFRKISIPVELENYKEKIFQLSNIHYQTEYLKLEEEKWKIYKTSAMNKDSNSNNERVEPMETIVIDDNNNNDSIPISRPLPNEIAGPPAPLDFSEYSEFFDDWLPEPKPGQKRKLGHRRDDPPTPPSPRQPPPIVPRRTLPPRDVNIPLTGGSVRGSPFFKDRKHQEKEQRSFNALLPLERHESKNDERQTTIANIERESSMILSPIKSSTPEIKEKSPSVMPKNGTRATTTTLAQIVFEDKVIPIECRYFFKKLKQKYTLENIETHRKFLEKQYKSLEDERDSKLKLFFPEEKRAQVISFVKSIVEKNLENKQVDNQKRIDNLILDHKREKALRIIRNNGNESEQQYIENLKEKFQRTLDLKLQLDKLEKRFVENMPPPSLNIFDKLQLYAKQLKPDDKNLSSLREQWKNVLRKTKLELTSLMRQAKIIELEQSNKEYETLKKELPKYLCESYDTICHGMLNQRKLVHALSRYHPGHPTGKLHPHFTHLSFPPQANNKAYILKNTEAQILNLGPKFVPPAPERVLERLPNEIETMKEKVSEAWRKATKTIGREPPIVKKFCERIENEIRKTVSAERPQVSILKPTITLFQKLQKQKKVIFRQTDKSKVFHVDNPENYVEKSAAYMSRTNAYIETPVSPLKEMIEKTDKFLRNLVTQKKMPQYMLNRLRPSLTESELPHLYYNPKDHKIGEPLRPIVSGMNSPLSKLSSFLDRLIRPLFDKHTPYALLNSMIFIKHLGQFKTTLNTNLYTFDITDLYTMIPQREAVLAVCDFLGRHGYKKVQGLTINTIKEMFMHVLENSYFVLQLPGLEPKFYRQIKGGAMGSACTQVLADIYVRKWESDLVHQQQQQGELYLRFRDDVFLTTKLPQEKIEQILTELNKKDPNISITWEGGKTIDYLDVTTKIEVPNFRTKVFRKLAAQPYVLPFHSSHPIHIKRNIPYAAAVRATRICSHPEDLREELEKIRITLLLNKYPPRFIDKQMKRFFQDATGQGTSDLLLGEKHPIYRKRTLEPEWSKKEKRKIEFDRNILLHFTYTPSLACFGSRFHQIWQEIFENTPLDDIPVMYANRMSESLRHLLVKKRPSREAIKLLP